MSSSLITWSSHPHIHNKPPEWEPRFGNEWVTHAGTLDDLRNEISAGKAFICAEMTSRHRTAAAFRWARLVAVDVDYGLSLEEFEAHPLAQSACLVYTTASHQNAPGKHRFRVIFLLDTPIDDGELYKAVVTLLTHSLGGDRSCTDPTRLFYGNDQAEFPFWQPDARLNPDILDDARKFLENQRAACQNAASEVDEASILRAIYVLEQVLEPTKDGERDRYLRISAAARAGGDALFPAWSDWASRSHHGSGSKRRQSSERWFRGLRGTSLGTLFFLASEQDPDWRKDLPEELRNYEGSHPKGYSDTYAGYSLEDFMGDPNVAPPTTPAASIFDATVPWATVTKPAAAGYDDEDFEGEHSVGTPAGDGEADKPAKRGPGRPKKDKEDPVASMMNRLRNLYPGIRRNLVTGQVEFGPKDRPQIIPDTSTAYIRISRGTGELLPKTAVNDLIQVIARENQYNPVKTYLENCLSRAEPCPYFRSMATELLGVDEDEIDNPTISSTGQHVTDAILERFLIGAVARAMDPGCEMPWMPVLVGSQNVGKSAFLRYLTPEQTTGPHWSTTVQQGISHVKDRPHILHAGWIVVLDEVERYFQRRYVEELKNLVSTRADYSAKKYENEAHYPRSFVLAGATNNSDFLVDPTGNRRFLPIIVHGKVPAPENKLISIIDLDRLQADRDSIWAAALQAYMAGRPWIFTSSELAEIERYIEGFGQESTVGQVAARVIETFRTGYYRGRGYVLLTQVLEQMRTDIKDFSRLQGEVIDEMKRLGWENKRVRLSAGKVTRIWLEPVSK
jgi:hypothetical protein